MNKLSILLISALVLSAALFGASPEAREQYMAKGSILVAQGVDANNHDSHKIGTHDGNKILTRYHNTTGIADFTVPGRYDCGIYPIGSGRSYLAEFYPIVGVEVRDATNRIKHIISDAMVSPTSSNPFDQPDGGNYVYQFRPQLGYANPNDSVIAMSDDSLSWPFTWPGRAADWDGYWDGQYGKYARADQESYFVADDYNNDEFKHFPFLRGEDVDHFGEVTLLASSDSGDFAILTDMNTDFTDLVRDIATLDSIDTRTGTRADMINIEGDQGYRVNRLLNEHQLLLETYIGNANGSPAGTQYWIHDGVKRGVGVDIAARGYQWSHPAADDILIFTYWITNRTPLNYEKVAFGMYGDADVGDDGDQRDDDAWFDTVNDIVYQWDHDLWSIVKGGFKPAYFGWKYLESPGSPLDGLDNDEDGMIDESQFDNIDNDGDWNPYVDDLGTDGIGPNFQEYVGPDPDGTEGNGIPDAGEPNFEYTDNDESDQIGLTSFMGAAWPAIPVRDDNTMWDMIAPGNFSSIAQTVDIIFMYASAYFELPSEQERKFAVSIVFGSDYDDILRNAQTMQEIYNSDYNFAKPPNKPRVHAVGGDGKVTLYWDDLAEYSLDPIYGYDFEGYRIYRATDPAFNEVWTITDTYGNPTYNSPVAQFDLDNDLSGPHPYGLNGIHLDMGTNTGLRHSWTDHDVENGQTYYYAVVAYDKGYDDDFYERGLTDRPNLQPITPSECNKKITINASGEAVDFDLNTVRVVPNAASLGYIAPDFPLNTESSASSGEVIVETIDPSMIRNGDEYMITFKDWSNDLIDNDGDWQTWADDSSEFILRPTLTLLVPPNSDTLDINISEASISSGVEEDTERFYYAGYWFVTTFVDSETVVLPDTTYISWFVDVPDTSFILPPTLGVWDGWEELHDDLGEDGCNDEYEDGSGGCLDEINPAYAGGDPNNDNWHPDFNPDGTQANAQPNTGEPHVDLSDIDEAVRMTSSFDLINMSTGEVLLRDQTDFSGDGRGLVTDGFRLSIQNEEIELVDLESGWTRPGINMDVTFGLVQAFSYSAVATPFDYTLTVRDVVVDTAINNKQATFDIYDETNQRYVDIIYVPTEGDSILRHDAKVFPVLSGADEDRVSWRFFFQTKASNVSSIIEWNDLVLCGSYGRGIAAYNGSTWSTIGEEQGLLSNDVRVLTFDRSGRLLVGSAGGLNVHTPDGWVGFQIDIASESTDPDNQKVDFVSFNDVLEDADGILWGVSNKGVLKWDWTRTTRAQILKPGIYPVWVDFETDEFGTDTLDQDTGLLQREANSLLLLDDGTVVIGSKSKGLQFYHPDTDSWTYITEDNSTIPSDDILCLAKRDDEIWVGTKRGLGIFHVPDSTFTYEMGRDSLPDRKVNNIAFGSDNRVHVVTPRGYSIMTLGASDTTYQNFDKDSVPQLVSNKLQAVTETSDGAIWVGSLLSTARYLNGSWEDWAPQPGDECIIKTTKPFSALDTVTFVAMGADIQAGMDKSVLKEIAVVPNPYVVTASWEPEHLYATGRGQRKIDFINLPPECTIRIYTLSGKFVDKIDHNSALWTGAESWDLLTRDGLEIAYGVYIFHVEALGIGEHIGKFAVIK